MEFDTRRRLVELEDSMEAQQKVLQDLQLSLKAIEIQMATMATALKWGLAIFGVATSLTSGILWLINHVK